MFVHVPLAVPHAVPGASGPWYCTPGRLHVDTPTPAALLASYERTLRAHGHVTDRFGFGTWTIGANPTADVAFEDDDHIELDTHASDAVRFLPAFLRRMRADLAQQEALGEIAGAAEPSVGDVRTRVTVTLAASRADYATLRTLHVIFGDRGNGGASQFADASGVRVYSGVTHAASARIESELRRAGFAYTTEAETFVTVDAPACAGGRPTATSARARAVRRPRVHRSVTSPAG